MSSKEAIIQEEMRRLATFVVKARQEVAAIVTAKDSAGAEKSINHISVELEEVVRHTEEATNKIMDQAEEVLKLAGMLREATMVDRLGKAATGIMEACSFQDITGQRIKKVLAIVEQVEMRVDRLVDLFGGGLNEIQTSALATGRERSDESLLAGPQMAGEGVTQDQIDAMLKGD